MPHAKFVEYAKNILGLDLKITRTRVIIISGKLLIDQVSLIVPDYFDEIARAKLGKLDLDVVENYVRDNKPEQESIRSCTFENLLVGAIIRIRSQTGLGLKEAKDLFDANRDNWNES